MNAKKTAAINDGDLIVTASAILNIPEQRRLFRSSKEDFRNKKMPEQTLRLGNIQSRNRNYVVKR